MKYAAAACLLVFVQVGLHCTAAKKLPSFIKACNLTEGAAKVGSCIVQRVQELKPQLLKGIPELKLPKIEPLHIDKLELHTGNQEAVTFDATVSDMQIYGVKEFDLVELNLDFDKHNLKLHVRIPKLHIEGNYVVKGKVLLFEVNSSGPMTVNITDVDAKSFVNFTIVEKEKKMYLTMNDDYKLEHKYANPSVYFGNLFIGNEQLSEQVNNAVNENIDSLAKEVNPLIFESVHKLMFGIMKPVFDDFSLEELFES